jgi:colanic acid/amylovoran biosynthesis protein
MSEHCGIVRRSECGALIDISGYAYGDAFPHIRIRNGADRARAHTKRGHPVVLMPQMFGPFKKPEARSHFMRLLESVKLVFARERLSFEVLRELMGDDPRLRQCPDITIFSPSAPVEPARVDGVYACIVPNERMLDQGGKDWGDTYVDRLVAAGTRMVERGVKPVVVVHSADPGDRELAERLLDELQGKGELFHDADPFALKAFIGRSRFLVGSRFHSIVAAFSTGVPGVALGWAHKYEALASDFGVPELQHRATDDIDHLVSLVDQLCDDTTRERFASTIVDAKAKMRPQVDAAWREVMELLRLPAPMGST